MQSIMNLKIKYRESFRPFAPTCLVEKVSEYFDLDVASPYMLLVAQVRPERCLHAEQERVDDLRVWVNRERSDIPAVTHVDYSARVQTVDRRVNPQYHDIIREFETLTGCATIINTSFNVRGEPIVCTPEDAYRCFMRTEMDYLVLGSFLLSKPEQPAFADKANWREDYGLD
jgi:carbamoyltransferase